MCNTEEETQAAEHACSLMVHEIAVCFARYTYRTGVKACANRSTVDIEQVAKFCCRNCTPMWLEFFAGRWIAAASCCYDITISNGQALQASACCRMNACTIEGIEAHSPAGMPAHWRQCWSSDQRR